MIITLIKPTEIWKEKIWDYRNEFIQNGETIHGSALLGEYDSFEKWYSDVVNNSSEDTVAEGWVTSSTFLGIDENEKIVGLIDIRHRLNNYLLAFGGHIGYSVRKSERQKGYATQMLKTGLKVANELGIDKVLITCEKNNIASAATILKCGGILENEVFDDDVLTQRYWIDVK